MAKIGFNFNFKKIIPPFCLFVRIIRDKGNEFKKQQFY